MSEPIQPIIEIINNNTITDITHQQTTETSRQLKTNDYTLNAVKRTNKK